MQWKFAYKKRKNKAECKESVQWTVLTKEPAGARAKTQKNK